MSKEFQFKIGDRIVDEKHPDYKVRVGTVVTADSDRNAVHNNKYPAAIKWDDGVTFHYTQECFDRLRTAWCNEKTIAWSDVCPTCEEINCHSKDDCR